MLGLPVRQTGGPRLVRSVDDWRWGAGQVGPGRVVAVLGELSGLQKILYQLQGRRPWHPGRDGS